MRRLDILLAGTSPVLERLCQMLDEQGHGACLAPSHDSLQAAFAASPQLVIEDGSLDLAAHWQARADCPLLALRVGASGGDDTALPCLEALCWCGSAIAQRLIERQPIEQPSTGNGQQLRHSALETLSEVLGRLVTRFSRNSCYFDEAPAVQTSTVEHEHALQWLEHLAWLHPFNRTARPELLRSAATGLMEQIDRSLSAFADRPALNLDGQRLSYRQLHALAAGIQRAILPLLPLLRDEPAVVALCLDKSPALYAGLLAVLGCGAVYLPMDPATPVDRRRRILEDAGVCLVLHDGQPSAGAAALDLRTIIAVADQALPPLVRHSVLPQAPAVAIYTSGTTGMPKGVLLSQYNLAHFSAWYAEHVTLDGHSRVLQFSTIGFDASLLDILPTFTRGAELVIPSHDQRRDPQQLVALLQRQEVSHAFLPPALLSVLPPGQPLGLRHLITGGDVCEPQVIARLAGQCRLYNIYGPTETTVLATTRLFAGADNNRNLGMPIANSQVLVLDPERQPVLEGTSGELYITGPGVGLGYLNNPALSNERFVQLTLPDGQQLRAYRTGDSGKWTSAGLVLCGRLDNQVKIRGYRVEPEEIEHCLRQSQLFAQVAVVIGEQQRVLAFVARPLRGDALDALRAHAAKQLPDYMRPASCQVLEQMPCTANGKIDRQALLSRQPAPLSTARRLPPVGPTEARLCTLWARLLELSPADISTDDSFFNLGGHSILLSRLLLEVREQFGRGVAINRFIEQPTVQRLAALLQGDGQALGTPLARLEQDANRDLQLVVQPLDRLGDVHKVIVTGANSFLGVHLVESLLAWGASEVACLVRRSAEQTAQQRFAEAVAANRLEIDPSRVRVYEADLPQPRLGLSATDYDYLDGAYGALLHNAAQVNHVLDYQALAADNIEPLFECLRLCEGRRKKIFNFVSTLSACSAVDKEGRVLEQDAAPTPPLYIRNGYNLGKWVAERILQRARAQGVSVNLFRPGNITFDSRNGVCQPQRNRLMLMLKGSLQLEQVPDLGIEFDLMPVDFLARFIAFHASRHLPEQCVFNLHNPQPLRWHDYVSAFHEQGHAFELVSVERWQRELARVDRDNALFEVLGFYLDGFEEDIGDISDIEHGNARAGVLRMGADYPAKTPALLRQGYLYLSDIGFI